MVHLHYLCSDHCVVPNLYRILQRTYTSLPAPTDMKPRAPILCAPSLPTRHAARLPLPLPLPPLVLTYALSSSLTICALPLCAARCSGVHLRHDTTQSEPHATLRDERLASYDTSARMEAVLPAHTA